MILLFICPKTGTCEAKTCKHRIPHTRDVSNVGRAQTDHCKTTPAWTIPHQCPDCFQISEYTAYNKMIDMQNESRRLKYGKAQKIK